MEGELIGGCQKGSSLDFGRSLEYMRGRTFVVYFKNLSFFKEART